MPATPRSLAGVALALGVVAAYANSLQGAFVFDDLGAIVRNPTLHSLWPLGGVLSPPAGGVTVTGRPLLNLSFAVNFAAGGLNPFGYHLVNLAIHVLATLLFFDLAHRTLATHGPEAKQALPVAFGAALLWSLHPLQTESVTYVSQRAESLMGLFLLASLWGFRLAIDRKNPRWLLFSAFACLGGMLTKEVMAAAPLLILLYDRTFVAGGFSAAWRQRRLYYLGLAATWLALAGEVLASHGRGTTVGFNLGLSWPGYLWLQCSAVIHYLRLTLWPSPLIFDYGLAPAFDPPLLAAAAALAIILLVAATLWCLRWRPAWGFLGFWFMAVLAPTSLIPGNRQTWAEHRMYLALVPLAVLFALFLLGRRRVWMWPVLGVIAICLGVATHARNRVYRSGLSLWSDTVTKRPENAYAQYNLGVCLLDQREYAQAEAPFRTAIALQPGYAEAHNNLGNVLLATGRPDPARTEFEAAARLAPDIAEFHNNLGNLFAAQADYALAAEAYRAAISADPTSVAAHAGLGASLQHRHDLSAALDEFDRARAIDPTNASVALHRAELLLAQGRKTEASAEFDRAVRLDPASAVARFNYGNALAQDRRFAEAVVQYRASLQLQPNDPLVHYTCATALYLFGHVAEARQEYAEAIRLKPDFEQAKRRLQLLGGP